MAGKKKREIQRLQTVFEEKETPAVGYDCLLTAHNSAAEVHTCMSSFRSCTRVLNNLPLNIEWEVYCSILLKFFSHSQDLPRGTCAQLFQIHYNR